jgi:hypothetical protein
MADDVASELTPKQRHHRVRRAFVAILVILGCLLSFLSVMAIWARNNVLDTNGYVSTVAPLAKNPQIINATADRITAGVMERTDIADRLAGRLPATAASAVTASVQGVVHNAALQVLSSDQFATLWKEANRNVHAQVVAALTGKGSSRLKVENGAVILDLTPVADKVREKITSLGFDVNNKVPGRVFTMQIELFKAPNAQWAKDGADALQKIAWVLPVLALACFAAAIALSLNRRRTILRSGLGVSAAMAILLISLALGRVPYLGLFPRSEGKQAGGAAYDQILHDLRLQSRAVFAFGLVVAIGAWLAGPSASAVHLRGIVTRRERTHAPGAFARWVGRTKVGLRVLVIALGAIALVAIDQPSGWTVLVVALIVVVLLAIIELVGRAAPETVAT